MKKKFVSVLLALTIKKIKYTHAQKILLTMIYIMVYTIRRKGGALL